MGPQTVGNYSVRHLWDPVNTACQGPIIYGGPRARHFFVLKNEKKNTSEGRVAIIDDSKVNIQTALKLPKP